MFNEESPPSPEAFTPDEAYLVVVPYLAVGRYRDAMEFAYHQLRTHFSEVYAHHNYLLLMFRYGEKAGIPRSVEVVDEESAVRLEDPTTEQQRWVVIEDRQPDLARNEHSCSTSGMQTLIGKRIDDTVDLNGPSLQPQYERIVAIQSKYVHLYQDVMAHCHHRFPGVSAIQPLYLGSEEGLDPSPLIDFLQNRRQHVEEATTFYRTDLCSLHFVASQLGTDELQLMTDLAAHDESFVRCVECMPQEYSEAVAAGFSTNKIVLDLSAIVTIARLDAWGHLDGGLEFLVSRATSDRIAQWLDEVTETGAQPAAYACATDDGRMVIQEVTAEQLRSRREEVKGIVDAVATLCTVKSSIALADLDPRRREQYIRVCGFHNLEAVRLAQAENALLWTDDLFVAMVAEADFGVKRVWTQLAFNVLRVSEETFSEVTAKLAAWNYVVTIWRPQDVVAAGNLCDWDVSQWPLRQCIRLIGTCQLPLHEKAGLCWQFFRLLRRSACIELRQTAVVQAVLNALGGRTAVESIRRQLAQVSLTDCGLAEFLNIELLYWLRLR